MGLGPVSAVTLAKAREKAAEASATLKGDRRDPIEEKHAEIAARRLARAKSVTFRWCAESCIESKKPEWRNEKHAEQWVSTMTAYVYPLLGDLPVAAVDTSLVLKVLDPIWTAKPETASRVRGRIETILGWATVRGFRAGDNPARLRGHLGEVLPKKEKIRKVRHQPALPYAEIGSFVRELRDRDFISAKALEFTILTAARTSETVLAKWSEIDLQNRIWTIPAGRMKSEREHRVPLSGRAVEILKSIIPEEDNPYVFVGAKTGKSLSNMAMLELLKGMRAGLTVHGFRSSFRDWAAEKTNFAREIAEASLAHVLASKTEAAYQRGDLLEKRRKLMEAWSKHCSTPAVKASADDANKVTPINSRAA